MPVHFFLLFFVSKRSLDIYIQENLVKLAIKTALQEQVRNLNAKNETVDIFCSFSGSSVIGGFYRQLFYSEPNGLLANILFVFLLNLPRTKEENMQLYVILDELKYTQFPWIKDKDQTKASSDSVITHVRITEINCLNLKLNNTDDDNNQTYLSYVNAIKVRTTFETDFTIHIVHET
jgi:hypothetical protein